MTSQEHGGASPHQLPTPEHAQAQDAGTGSAGSSAAGLGSSSGGHAVTGPSRRVSTQEVQLVQNLIERCMQQYIPQAQVVNLLQIQAKVEPSFTTLVWQKLEEQNPDFFRMYYIRLKLKEQIVMFNYLLEQQVNMVQKLYTAWLQSMPPMMPPPGAAMRPPGMPMPPGMPPFPFPGMPGSMPLPPGMLPTMPPGLLPGSGPAAAMPQQMPAAAAAAGLAMPAAAAQPMGTPAATTSAAAAAAAAAGPGVLSGSQMEGLDLLDAALEASVNMDLLHLHGTLDDLMDGMGLGAGSSADGQTSSGLALELNLPSMPKTFSFSDLSNFDMGMTSLAPGLEQHLNFSLLKEEEHPGQGLGMPSDGLSGHGLGHDALPDTPLHADAALGVGPSHSEVYSMGMGAACGGSEAFNMGMDMDMGMTMDDMGMGLGGADGADQDAPHKRKYSLGDMAGLDFDVLSTV